MQKQGYTIFTGPLKSDPKGAKALRIAEKTGQNIEFIKKNDFGNKHNVIDGKTYAKIMNDENEYKPKQVCHELKIAIGQARQQNNLTQEKLAHLLNIPKADLNSWEAGKSVPSGLLIAKMDKVLGVKLPRPTK